MNKDIKILKEEMQEVIDNPTFWVEDCGEMESMTTFEADECKTLLDYINQLEKEVERLKEREKLVTEHYDVMVRHAGNLEGKIIQLETNIDEAIQKLNKSKEDKWLTLNLTEIDELLSILERGKK